MRRQMVLAGPWSDPSTITSSVLKDLTSARKVCSGSDWKKWSTYKLSSSASTLHIAPLILRRKAFCRWRDWSGKAENDPGLSISAGVQLWIWEISHYLPDLRWCEQSKELQNLKNGFSQWSLTTVYCKSSFWCCFSKELSNSLCANVDAFVPHQNFWTLLDTQRDRGLKYINFLWIWGK